MNPQGCGFGAFISLVFAIYSIVSIRLMKQGAKAPIVLIRAFMAGEPLVIGGNLRTSGIIQTHDL